MLPVLQPMCVDLSEDHECVTSGTQGSPVECKRQCECKVSGVSVEYQHSPVWSNRQHPINLMRVEFHSYSSASQCSVTYGGQNGHEVHGVGIRD